ncbi:diacylglycerol kinase family lipid kinase [Mesorhizobium sp. NBSH29]|uniref:diacylglycerol/lipid kinase family protein n=1 Tax=Mesorhizobium sp. NBSH29 TaxID=2654249 RepID=UPI0018968000|nr:diacylglycerol kinase family protein [Mesorhizobium sp. NBSH29]QPC85712.1 diacylglycerol kinase family lipid kinase [Mesorhizobium sp. NBSH29]
MHFVAVLNRDGGTLRTTDLSKFSETLRETLSSHGHTVDIEIVTGKNIVEALTKAASQKKTDVLMAGGGDGTISAAAGLLKGRKKALAALPAGTMNLFARSLKIPLDLEQAVKAFATGEIRNVDIGTANDRPFVHQLSVGMHARMVHLRERMEFGSRFGKIGASARAAWTVLKNPTPMKVSLLVDKAEIEARATGIGISNNLFGEGHLPYADHPDGGTLGVYLTKARTNGELLSFVMNLARGKWRDNEQVTVHQAQKVVLRLLSSRRRQRCVLDGELIKLERETVVVIHPAALRVLVPMETPQ